MVIMGKKFNILEPQFPHWIVVKIKWDQPLKFST